MRLTNFSDYSLRVLMYLGTRDDGLATIRDIATAYGISENHLMKVVHWLAQHGYVETIRGKGGGLRLARAPARIRLGEVVRATEEQGRFVECFDREASECRIAPACMLKGVLVRALDAFFEVLDAHTLADLLTSRPRLARIFAGPAVLARRA